jgi:hypothetical protein
VVVRLPRVVPLALREEADAEAEPVPARRGRARKQIS